jgi:hypothetical protein
MTTPTNNKLYTWSGWVKRGNLTSAALQALMSGTAASGDAFGFNSSDKFFVYLNSLAGYARISTQILRDPTAWYHVVVAVDTSNATAQNRVRVYINNSEITTWDTNTSVTLNSANAINSAVANYIGNNQGSVQYFDGYLAEVNFIDGQQLTPSSFGSTDATTGQWIPKKYSSTYGTNGFYLNFSDIALTSGSNAGLGKDFSGNANYWNTNNISVTAGATYDAMKDVPTLTSATVSNYCLGNPLDVSIRGAFTNANLTCTVNGGGALNGGSARVNTFNFTQLPVKWYWESTVTNSGAGRALFGMEITSFIAQSEAWTGTAGWYFRADGVTNLTSPGTFTTNDIMMFAYDGNTGKFWVGKNGTWTNSGVPSSGTNPNKTLTAGTEYWLLFNVNTGGAGTAVCEMNYGQRAFSYTPPTGFISVNTYNLPALTVLKGNQYMDATLYTGNLTGQSITNDGAFKPDLVWIKSRSAATSNKLTDSVRGATIALVSNSTAAETTDLTGLTAFNSNGFTVGASTVYNNTAATYVGWQWQAGQGSSSSNTSGTITSTVSVNTTAGFSTLTYTGTGANATVGHGLGIAPKMIIVKQRGGATSWNVHHTSIGAGNLLYLEATNASTASATTWNSTLPTSTVFSIGTAAGTNTNTGTYIAYCWAEISGFSKFGSYVGNGSTDGTFVYLGLRAKYIMIKRTDSTSDWYVWDTSRNTYNVVTNTLLADTAGAETSATSIDILSNSFKCRSATVVNASGGTYIYAAFAENPFKNANAR